MFKTNCQHLIEQEIKRFGPMGFDQFMDLALYHPLYGYYSQKKQRRGRLGDYFTSNQVSRLFPEILADIFLQMKSTLDSEQFSLVEMGAGDGEILESVLEIFRKRGVHRGIRVWVVEKSRPAREKIWKKLSRFPKCSVVSSVDEINLVSGIEGCIFSNELFDAFPFKRMKKKETGWDEIHVDLIEGQLQETPLPSKIPIEPNENLFEAGQEIEWRSQINDFYADIASVFSRGYILTFDYGYPRRELWAPERRDGTWLCYHKHKVSKDIFANLGEQDMTAHIDFSQLAEAGKSQEFEPALYCKQGIFLSYMGEKKIEEFLNTNDETQRRQRASAVQQLLHPEAMGGLFKVLLQSKGAPLPEPFKKIPNRMHRL